MFDMDDPVLIDILWAACHRRHLTAMKGGLDRPENIGVFAIINSICHRWPARLKPSSQQRVAKDERVVYVDGYQLLICENKASCFLGYFGYSHGRNCGYFSRNDFCVCP